VPRAPVNGFPMHYQQAGSGADVVMVHGLLSNLAFWYLSVVPELLEDFRVTVYDLRGHGLSGMPPRGYRTADLADDLDALLDHLEIERAHIVGHSFGGAVALHYAALHPERVHSLTAADAHVPSLQTSFTRRGTLQFRRAAARLARDGIGVPADTPRVAFAFFEELARHPRRGHAPLEWTQYFPGQERWTRLMRSTTARRELGDRGLTPERILSINRPTLAICGEHSGYLPTLRALERLLTDCRRVIVSGSGHFFPLVQPEVLAREIRRLAVGRE
jgi:pimeloyl-ACP methyl ester carboxylesterase